MRGCSATTEEAEEQFAALREEDEVIVMLTRSICWAWYVSMALTRSICSAWYVSMALGFSRQTNYRSR